MRFYDRDDEVRRLKEIRQKSRERSRMTIVMGRRRIGKTRLIFETFKDETFLYFFVARKADNLLSQEFAEEIKAKLAIPLFGKVQSSRDIFQIVLNYAKEKAVTVVFDEFQNYQYVNAAVFSDLQNLWDRHRDSSRCNLILMGSISTLMNRIFKNQKEPLFGRADYQVSLPPFDLQTTSEILADHQVVDPEALTDYMIFTGGVPKYLEQVAEHKNRYFFDFLDSIIYKDSLIINEGKVSLIEEFGKNYAIYFAILELIAGGKTKRSELMGTLSEVKELGGYLKNLTEELGIVRKLQPINARSKGKNIRYYLSDYFYSFWFRFIYKFQTALEAENYNFVREKIKQDWATYKGRKFEELVRDYLKTLSLFNVIGSYWDRKGENEIDIVAINDLEKIILFGECKLNPQKFNPRQLIEKSAEIKREYPNHTPYYRSFHPAMLPQLQKAPQHHLFSNIT
jgi:AAA+ ATPase superfamily predicted ATPase